MLEMVKLDSGTLPAIANAIREKTGDTALLLPSQMAGAIAGISSGVDLPALTAPAEDSDVLNGKEYIGAAGEKRTGTLVDQIYEIETIMGSGGISLEVESTAGASKTFAFPEPNLQPENIKSGISIFNVAGSVKEIRTETGTITPAEDTQTITIPATGNVLYIVGVSVPAETGYVIAASYSKGNYNIGAQMGGYFRYASATSIISAGIGVSIQDGNMIVTTGNTARLFAAGATYRWTVYNWEDDA